ncbi:MAG: UDP-N-acetylglucosamine 2-epimerase (non-hydrolyzing) [Oscillospiraceae bacterium]|nr:uDP-N-acetylglucosamine 2-epimerase [Firmicutes bacterium CAG:137]
MSNRRIKVMSVFGTRPEAIKMAPLVQELASRPEFESLCCLTGQHRQMLDSVMEIFHLKAQYDLDIMERQQTLSSITTKTLLGMERVLTEAEPDLILVHGDTSTTFAGALAAFYHKVPVGHVEAGLRTYDKYSPFPEEMNRTLVGDIATLHFAPTRANAENLRRESVQGEIFITGNTVIDAMKTTVRPDFVFEDETLNRLDFPEKQVITLTCHRRENYGAPMEAILTAVRTIVEENPNVEVVYPVHLSPVVQDCAHRLLGDHPRIHLIAPLDVAQMHNLMARSYLVLTDSGGLQEEAPALGKPVLVLRRETERPEAIAAGTAKLAGVETEPIVALTQELLQGGEAYARMAHAVNPYGDGKACGRIADAIAWHFGVVEEKPWSFGE